MKSFMQKYFLYIIVSFFGVVCTGYLLTEPSCLAGNLVIVANTIAFTFCAPVYFSYASKMNSKAFEKCAYPNWTEKHLAQKNKIGFSLLAISIGCFAFGLLLKLEPMATFSCIPIGIGLGITQAWIGYQIVSFLLQILNQTSEIKTHPV